MDFGHLAGLVIVIFLFGGGFIKRILDIMEKRMESRISAQDQNVVHEIAAMRQELAQLRDTSTQFDMSIEHRLDNLERRLGSVEAHGKAPKPAAPPIEAQEQTVGLPRA